MPAAPHCKTKRKPGPRRKSASHSTARRSSARKSNSRRGPGFFRRLLAFLPGWAWWCGIAVMVAFSVWLFRTLFSEPVSDVYFPVEYTVHGVDVSHHQGAIDWELLRNRGTINNQPVSFVFIKATEGTSFVDSRFVQNFSKARQYGVMRGAYHFYRPSLPAQQQADFFISQVQLLPGDLPPVLDVEAYPIGLSREVFRSGVLEWLRQVEQHYGVKPILYTYHSFHQQYLNDSVFSNYPYWIAHYHVDSVRYQGSWHFWQHTDRGEVAGIEGNVDLNIFNGTFDQLRQLVVP